MTRGDEKEVAMERIRCRCQAFQQTALDCAYFML